MSDSNTPSVSTPSEAEPEFWRRTDTTRAASAASESASVDADQPRLKRRTGRSWIWASLIMSVVAVVGAIVLPHFAAILALISAGSAWNGIRLSTGTPKLGVGALIASIVVFVACVIYTIVTVQLGFAYLENLQS
ncbi:hypothetical protein [Brevibacterium senegalense]|uniref:hypothetical protein n=1 Tax=Brevibacterium senegalense TaxID=1033736 RepID=UPI00036BF35E|nr:hypothetical protein [Brevibacterium senegalense]